MNYGTDYNMNATVDEQGDIATVEDMDNLRQRIHNILLVPLDYYEDDFGSNLYKLLGNDLSTENIRLVELYIKSYLKRDERIKDVRTSNVVVNINRDIIIHVTVVTFEDTEIDTKFEVENNGLVNYMEEEGDEE